VARAGNTVSNH